MNTGTMERCNGTPKSLPLPPLIDRGFNLRENPENAILSADNWLGYVIYRMVPGGTFNGQPYYLLFGFDRFGTWRRQKILDVLTFDAAGKPQFGLPVFETYTERGQPLPDRSRIILEYGAEGQVAMQYEPATNRIVYENLILMPGSNEEGPLTCPTAPTTPWNIRMGAGLKSIRCLITSTTKHPATLSVSRTTATLSVGPREEGAGRGLGRPFLASLAVRLQL
jgi:hypothetical protein